MENVSESKNAVKKIAVIGAGTMGRGIAEVALLNNYVVTLIDASKSLADSNLMKLFEDLSHSVEKGRITMAAKAKAMGMVSGSWTIADIKDAAIVIEAVPEDAKLKRSVFMKMEKYAPKDAVLATNTSSISIDSIAASVKDKGRVVGTHFFNPVPIMKLVEIVAGKATAQETLSEAKKLVESLGKTAVIVKNSPGFVSNRMLMVFINEAVRILEDGVADKEAIDTVAKLGFNHPMGPLELADLIGLDVCRDIIKAMYMQTKDKKFKPADTFYRLVKEGKLGRKSGGGFYSYG